MKKAPVVVCTRVEILDSGFPLSIHLISEWVSGLFGKVKTLTCPSMLMQAILLVKCPFKFPLQYPVQIECVAYSTKGSMNTVCYPLSFVDSAIGLFDLLLHILMEECLRSTGSAAESERSVK